jgi:hypothetical protein
MAKKKQTIYQQIIAMIAPAKKSIIALIILILISPILNNIFTSFVTNLVIDFVILKIVLDLLRIKLPAIPRDAIKKNRRYLAFVFIILIGIVAIYLLRPVIQSTTDNLKHFYYFNMNPRAQAPIFEKEYINNFNSADDTLNKSNKEIDDMQSGKETFYNGEQQVLVCFNNRDSFFNVMISIDNQSLMLNLPDNFKQFYKERLAADKADYEAFKVYRKGMEDFFTADDAMMNYDEKFHDFVNDVGDLSVDKYSQPQVDKTNYMSGLFQASYGNIQGIADTTDIFNQEILNYFQNEYDLYNNIKQYVDAFENKDQQGMNDAYTQMKYFLSNMPSTDINGIIIRWGAEKFGRIYKIQDNMHNNATKLYQKAYDYARKEKLEEILSAWKMKTPGAIQAVSPNV